MIWGAPGIGKSSIVHQLCNANELDFIDVRLSQLMPSETLILITHKTSMLDIVDRVIVMEKGNIIADGPKAQVLADLKRGKVKAAS